VLDGLPGVATSIGDHCVADASSLLMYRLHSARQTSKRGIGAGGRLGALSQATGHSQRKHRFQNERQAVDAALNAQAQEWPVACLGCEWRSPRKNKQVW
jgi:hypothetical protein